MANFLRIDDGYRFKFRGVKLNTAADALPPDKYAVALNVRGYRDNSVTTRPGQKQKFTTGANPVIDIGSYMQLQTDNLPRYLACDSGFAIWLDNGVQVGSLTTGDPQGLPAGFGVTFIPFRPNESPTPYLYVANGNAYQKFSAPSATNAVTQSNVGIKEPQAPCEAALFEQSHTVIANGEITWTNGGTAGAAGTGNRVTDTVGVVLPDPLNTLAGGSFQYSVQVASAVNYQRLMPIAIGSTLSLVQDVFPPLPTAVGIASIYYFAGTTGHCIIVPQNLAASQSEEQSIYAATMLTSLRRGAIIQIGAEYCYVWSATEGPDGSVAIELSTQLPHSISDTITSVPAIKIIDLVPTTGQAITAGESTYAVTTGTGTQSSTVPFAGGFNPFISAGVAYQPDDYITFGLYVDAPTNLTSVTILLDVGDGSFTQNYYYYSIRPSDLTGFLAAAITQLGAVQQIEQNAIIDALSPQAINNQLQSSTSAQASPGTNQWTQVLFPVTAFTRVGSDASKTLNNVNAVRIQVICTGTVNIGTANLDIFGSLNPDVGDTGAPYQYLVRPRSSVTGVVGNPSPVMRYGVSPRRNNVLLILPSATYDPQIDTWDIFRYGGSVTSYRYIGSTPSVNGSFIDDYSDDVANAGEAIEYDNFEPWPTVDVPNNGNAVKVAGTIAIVTSLDSDILRYLPGTLVQIGGLNVYTLWTRPIALGGNTYLLQFVENAGSATNVSYQINEPRLANQHMPYLWGPDASGTVFAVGNVYAAGSVFFSKPNAPDSAPDTYNIEIVPASEPLLGGEILDGLSFVASSERWWALYFQPDNPSQRYNFVQQPFPRGLAAPFGHCTDGRSIYWWAKDGIWSSSQGSLTDADLYNLFPHEGVPGYPQTYGPYTYQPPDYARTGTFRLAYANYFLYATYQDSMGAYHTLVCDLREGRIAWSEDVYTPVVTSWYHPRQPAGTLNSLSARYDEVVQGTLTGIVATQTPNVNDLGGAIPVILSTFESTGGDLRASEQWGDFWVDSTPAAAGAPLIATPMFLGKPAAPAQTVPFADTRTQNPMSVGGALLTDFLGILFTWTDNFAAQSSGTILHIWQPSFLHKPEFIEDRFTDWDNAGIDGAKWFQGFILHADTLNVVKGLVIRDTDTLTTHSFTPAVQQNGESEVAYSFNQPFIAHLVRIEPTDDLQWRFFDVRWIAEETPEQAETWQTQFSTHGLTGYMHLRQLSLTYASTQPVTFAATSYDGTSPAPVILPATGGAVQKIVFPFSANKGQLYAYRASSPAPFQIYVDKSEVMVGGWGRQSSYLNVPLIGGTGGDRAQI